MPKRETPKIDLDALLKKTGADFKPGGERPKDFDDVLDPVKSEDAGLIIAKALILTALKRGADPDYRGTPAAYAFKIMESGKGIEVDDEATETLTDEMNALQTPPDTDGNIFGGPQLPLMMRAMAKTLARDGVVGLLMVLDAQTLKAPVGSNAFAGLPRDKVPSPLPPGVTQIETVTATFYTPFHALYGLWTVPEKTTLPAMVESLKQIRIVGEQYIETTLPAKAVRAIYRDIISEEADNDRGGDV